MKLRYQYRNF